MTTKTTARQSFDRRRFLAGAGAAGFAVWAAAKTANAQPKTDKLTFVTLPNALAKSDLIWDASAFGYSVNEYLVSGSGPTYAPMNATEAGKNDIPDGKLNWGIRDQAYSANLPADYSVPPSTGTGDYTTRVIIYRPRDIKKFSGNVIFESVHDTGHLVVWAVVNRYLLTRGDIIVHVDLPTHFNRLKKRDPNRYSSLSMPDRSLFWTSLSQIATLIKSGGSASPLPVRGRHLYFTGYSGSADTVYRFLSYHHNGTRMPNGSPVFDGYLPMSHIRVVPPIDAVIISPATQSDMFGATSGDSPATRAFRKQYDSDLPTARRRRFEVPGAFHGPLPEPEPGMAVPPQDDHEANPFAVCSTSQKWPAEAEPSHVPNRALMEACFHQASQWVEKGIAPPHSPLIETGPNDVILTDENGNARGGLRLPDMAVPTDTFIPATLWQTPNCNATGYRVPFSREKLVTLYGTRERYLLAYDAAADKLVAEGFLLPDGAAQLKKDRRFLAPVF